MVAEKRVKNIAEKPIEVEVSELEARTEGRSERICLFCFV